MGWATTVGLEINKNKISSRPHPFQQGKISIEISNGIRTQKDEDIQEVSYDLVH